MISPFIARKATIKYCSEESDLVIGRVVDRQGEHYKIDLSDRFEGLLQYYDFEGASKRNRPTLEPGDLIYARVQRTSQNSGAILTCKSANNKKTWSSGESEFGPLKGGYLVSVPICLVQHLLTPGCNLLELIGSVFKFEITLGFNGKIWLKGENKTLIIVSNLLQKAAKSDQELIETLNKIKNS